MAEGEERTEPPAEEVVCAEGAPEWMVTFGDLMSLLLTFFILLLSFSNMEVIKYKMFSGSVMKAFGVQQVIPGFSVPQGRNIVATDFSMKFEAHRILEGMKKAVERHSDRTPSGRVDIEVFEDYRGIVVSLAEEAMFQRGRADLRPSVWPFLDDVLEVAQEHRAMIQAGTHTDSSPIKSPRFPSNDHLSADRAASVIRYFLGVDPLLPPARFEAAPFGETRPLAVNHTAQGRRKNRRVELIFQRPPRDFRQD